MFIQLASKHAEQAGPRVPCVSPSLFASCIACTPVSLVNAQTRLQIAHVGDMSEESFVMSNCGPDGLCTDASFPPGPSSL